MSTYGRRLIWPFRRKSADSVCPNLTGKVVLVDSVKLPSFLPADIRVGQLVQQSDKRLVAVKIPKPTGLRQDAKNHFATIVEIWHGLSHENILPLLGTCYFEQEGMTLVSPLCGNGNAVNYLKPDISMDQRKKIVYGVASGIAYLHSQQIIHGNLSTATILISDTGESQICAFTCAVDPRHSDKSSLFSIMSHSLRPGRARFLAPELLGAHPEAKARYTIHGDVYAFAMITLEVLTGRKPFHDVDNDLDVIQQVRLGQRPTLEDRIRSVPGLFSLLTTCWDQQPGNRPSATELTRQLKEALDAYIFREPCPQQPFFPQQEPPVESTDAGPLQLVVGQAILACKELDGQVKKDGEWPFAEGLYTNVWKGNWTDPLTGDVVRVAIKILRWERQTSGSAARYLRRLKEEASLWCTLEHDNVLPFLGICFQLERCPALVSPLCELGSINSYLNESHKRSFEERQRIVIGIAAGLQYLHSRGVIHGDLKPENILIDDDRVPRLCDFGGSKFFDMSNKSSTGLTAAPRYLAPELLTGGESDMTVETDVYAFSMVALRALTLKKPFWWISQDRLVLVEVADNKQHPLPPDRYPELFPRRPIWSVLIDCAQREPAMRPKMPMVSQRLENIEDPPQTSSSLLRMPKGKKPAEYFRAFTSTAARHLSKSGMRDVRN